MLLFYSGCINLSNVNDHDNSKMDTLIIGELSVESIYPLAVTNDNYWTLIPNIFNGLVEFDENFRIIPALAVSWNNPDDLT
jgi:ABC-type transport system substrate-binding protein